VLTSDPKVQRGEMGSLLNFAEVNVVCQARSARSLPFDDVVVGTALERLDPQIYKRWLFIAALPSAW
jgi:hypothetical protein